MKRKSVNITSTTIAVIFCLTMTSCSSIWLKYSGVLDEKPELRAMTDGDKDVVYLPLHHIGRKEYYEAMAQQIDSLQNEDYIVFYEMVNVNARDTSVYIELAKKFRKIQGDLGAANGYLDTLNNRIYGTIAYDVKYVMMNQPSFGDLGVDSNSAVNADISLEELIEAFEKKHGVITLSPCDINSDLKALYNCETLSSKLRKDFRKSFVLDLRNEQLAERIRTSEAKKIFVIYGARHYKGLLKELKAIDKRWRKK